jgi:hypothetical protein
MALQDFSLPASDPSNPNAFLMTPDQRAARLAAAIRQQQGGSDSSPIRSPWQGAARMAQALMGGIDEGSMNAQQAAGQKSASDQMAQILSAYGGSSGGGSSSSTPAAAPGTTETSGTPSDAAQSASDEFANSFTPQGAKVLAGVLQSESGFKTGSQGNSGTDASGVLSNGQGAYGIASWNGPRQADLANFAKQNEMDPADPDTQKLFVQWEVANNPAYADSYKALTDPNAKPGDIASTVVGNYENPAERNVGPETSKALGLAAALRGQVPGADVPAPGAGQAVAPVGPPDSQYPSGVAGGLGPSYFNGGATPAASAPVAAPAAGGSAIAVPGYDGTFTRAQANDGDGVPSQAEWDTAQKAAGQVSGPGAPSGAAPPNQAIAAPTGAPAAPGGQPAAAGGLPAAMGGAPPQQPSLKALMALAQNPWASPAQQQMAMGMIQKAIQPQMQTYTDKDGSVWQRDSTGKLTIVQDNSKSTNDMQNYAAAKDSGFQGSFLDYERADAQARSVPASAKEGNKFQVVGEDQFGNKQYGFVDPSSGKVTPYTGQPGQPGAPGAAPAVDPNLHGAEFMSTLDPGMQTQVQGVIDGRVAYPSGMLLRTPYGQKLAASVTQADPTFESGNATARTKAQADLASHVPNSMGGSTNSLNTALGHVDLLSKDAAALSNRGFTPWNTVANASQSVMGDPHLTNFNQDMTKVGEELTRVYRGAGGNEADIQRELNNLSSSSSPAQFQGGLGRIAELVKSKIDANQYQYDSVMGPMAKPHQLITKQAQDVVDRLTGAAGLGGGGQPSGAGASPAGGQPGVAGGASPASGAGQKLSPQDAAKLPSGTPFVGLDGISRVKH